MPWCFSSKGKKFKEVTTGYNKLLKASKKGGIQGKAENGQQSTFTEDDYELQVTNFLCFKISKRKLQ